MIMKILLTIVAGLLLSAVLLETASGCGQVTYKADRTWQSNECLFLTNKGETGRW